MVVTWPTCQADRSLEKLSAPENICCMFVTCPTCHAERSLVKLLALQNIWYMVKTCPTCQADRSLVKLLAPQNMMGSPNPGSPPRVVTPLVSHVETAPYACCDTGQSKVLSHIS
jgi:hypothetical protein